MVISSLCSVETVINKGGVEQTNFGRTDHLLDLMFTHNFGGCLRRNIPHKVGFTSSSKATFSLFNPKWLMLPRATIKSLCRDFEN